MSGLSSLLQRPQPPDEKHRVLELTPASARWRYVGFEVLRLAAGQGWSGEEPTRETCVVVLEGTVALSAGGAQFGRVGSRRSVFADEAPGAMYVPAGIAYSLAAVTAAEVALCTAPGARGSRAPRVIEAAEMSVEIRGQSSNTRYVRNILPETRPADSLLVVEVITPGGHSSSYPPHKHDTAAAGETALEEIYYHRLHPAQGFAFQRVYTEDRSLDETMCVHDGDLVLVPRGYHPVCVPHGYDNYYLNVMAGAERRWIARNDPAHEWLVATRSGAGKRA